MPAGAGAGCVFGGGRNRDALFALGDREESSGINLTQRTSGSRQSWLC